MDKKNIKRIMAREGLLLWMIIFGIASLFLSKYFYGRMEKILEIFNNTGLYGWGVQYSIYEDRYTIFRYLGIFLIIGYTGIMFIRFIIWAIRTLREKLIKKQLIDG